MLTCHELYDIWQQRQKKAEYVAKKSKVNVSFLSFKYVLYWKVHNISNIKWYLYLCLGHYDKCKICNKTALVHFHVVWSPTNSTVKILNCTRCKIWKTLLNDRNVYMKHSVVHSDPNIRSWTMRPGYRSVWCVHSVVRSFILSLYHSVMEDGQPSGWLGGFRM